MNPQNDLSSVKQALFWKDPKNTAEFQTKQSGVTELAIESEERFPRNANVLELGCSTGDDSAYFAEKGHDVIAIDVSEPFIEIASQRFADINNLEFRINNLSEPFGIRGQSIDAVYARLSLHYFSHATTMNIFGEIRWVLKPGGLFVFACRSVKDPLYGKGEEIEPFYYDQDGHYRHFFDEEYAFDLLEENNFENVDIASGEQSIYGDHFAFIRCYATAS